MKVRIGNEIYDSEEEPIMLILSEEDKKLIGDMRPVDNKYCSYPDIKKWTGKNFDMIKKWMKRGD